MKTLFIVNDILLFPCAICTVWEFISWFADIGSIWQRWFLGLTLPIVFLRIFLLPYLFSVLIVAGYLWALWKNGFPKKETLLFIALLIICALGLISLEPVFWAAMGV